MSKTYTNARILACGPLPKSTVTGVRLAFGLLIAGLKTNGLSHSVVDTTFRDNTSKPGLFSIGRATEVFIVITRVWRKLPFCDVYYATMSTSLMGFWRDYLTVMVAARLRKRIVLHLHGGGFENFFNARSSWMQRRIVNTLESTSSIIVLGKLLKEQFRCAGDNVMDKLVVVPNGLSLGVEEPIAQNKLLPDNGAPVELLYLSSLMPSKGFLDVLEAIKLLNEADLARNYHLHLCGSFVQASTEPECDIFDKGSLQMYLEREALTESVTYHGQVQGRVKEQRFQEAHVFLLPTYYPWEGQPLSIIEALAYSTPVISTAHKGIPEQVIDEETGRLVPPNSPNEIADAIINIASDEQKYTVMSHASRQHFDMNFRRDIHLKRLIAVLIDIEHAELTDIKL